MRVWSRFARVGAIATGSGVQASGLWTGRKPVQPTLSAGEGSFGALAGLRGATGQRRQSRFSRVVALNVESRLKGQLPPGLAAPPEGQVGNLPHRDRRGITLIEMLIVMALIALVAGMSYPSVSAGLDSLRLRSTSDAIIGFLNTALARADTRQQVVEILISQANGTLTATSGDHGFYKRLDIVSPMRILSVEPVLAADAEEQNQPRRFLVYPGGTVPKISIAIGNAKGRKRVISIDPITGVPQAL